MKKTTLTVVLLLSIICAFGQKWKGRYPLEHEKH